MPGFMPGNAAPNGVSRIMSHILSSISAGGKPGKPGKGFSPAVSVICVCPPLRANRTERKWARALQRDRMRFAT
ncbi:hypothetical protein D7S89_10915 [Trinickia fusca]|uniref:Uncharacterized protein n=1 Tax=Trinickia fusca TaxID=2419777 RepID=A0A494XME9_9BURK|nr:hypothetical protein D7S89_10915 [Trinickia fusca]